MSVQILALPWAAVAGPNGHGELESDPGFHHRAFSLHPNMKSLQAFVQGRRNDGWAAPGCKDKCGLQFRPAANSCYDGHIPVHTIAAQKGDLLLPLMKAQPNGVMVHTKIRKGPWLVLLAQAGIEEAISFGSPASALYSIEQMAFGALRGITVLDPKSFKPAQIAP